MHRAAAQRLRRQLRRGTGTSQWYVYWRWVLAPALETEDDDGALLAAGVLRR